MVERLAVNETVAGSSPAWAASTEGGANRHDGTRLEAGRGEQPLQVRVLSLPLSDKGVLLGEQPASKAGVEGSTPSALAPRGCLTSGRGRAARQPSDTRFEVGSTPAGPNCYPRGP